MRIEITPTKKGRPVLQQLFSMLDSGDVNVSKESQLVVISNASDDDLTFVQNACSSFVSASFAIKVIGGSEGIQIIFPKRIINTVMRVLGRAQVSWDSFDRTAPIITIVLKEHVVLSVETRAALNEISGLSIVDVEKS